MFRILMIDPGARKVPDSDPLHWVEQLIFAGGQRAGVYRGGGGPPADAQLALRHTGTDQLTD